MNRKIIHISRKPLPGQYSIENVFLTLSSQLEVEGYKVVRYLSPLYSKGVLRRLINCLHVLINQGGTCHIVGDVTYLALLMKRGRLIITIHDLHIFERRSGFSKLLLGLFWYQIPVARAKYITVISQATKEKLIKFFRVIPSKVIVIPNPVSGAFYFKGRFPSPLKNRIINVLQVGTKQNKNLSRVLRALANLSAKFDIRLTIIGEVLEHEIYEFRDAYQIVTRCNLCQEDIVRCYQEADVLLFVSTYEGFGMPIIEAQAVGTPVIASNIQPLVSVAGDGAVLVDPYNVSEISSAVEKILKSPELGIGIVKKGLNNVKKYQQDSIARQYAALYDLMER